MRRISTALVVGAVAMTAACGGGGGGRPSQSEVSHALQHPGKNSLVPASVVLNKKAADCIAAKLVGNQNISDDALNALVDDKSDYVEKPREKKAISGLTPTLLQCVTASLG